MKKTIENNYTQNRDIRALGVLITTILTFEIMGAYASLIVLFAGLSWMTVNSKIYAKRVNKLVKDFETLIDPYTSHTYWRFIQPISYVVLVSLITWVSLI
jgi:hypothetical protein